MIPCFKQYSKARRAVQLKACGLRFEPNRHLVLLVFAGYIERCFARIGLERAVSALRYQQFETAIGTANKERIKEAAATINFLQQHRSIVTISENIPNNPAFKKRVTHHDTKISNLLFDDNGKGLCVIDLDTVMPGYFISDLGDMLRTYISPVSEEEKDHSKIEIRNDYFKAIAEGYLGQMNDELSAEEKDHFVYAGKFMIYMQALRFVTDYINNDVYYGSRYEGQNFVRAKNQVVLLQKLMEKEEALSRMIDR